MIDLSDDSQRALAQAARTARENRSELVVLYPYRLKNQQVGEHFITLKQRLEREAYSRFETLKKNIKDLEIVPYTFSPEVGFGTNRLEAHLQTKPVENIFLCKSIASQADNDWQAFVKELHIPIEMIP